MLCCMAVKRTWKTVLSTLYCTWSRRLVLPWLVGERVCHPSHLERTVNSCILEKALWYTVLLSYRLPLVSPCWTGHTQHSWENAHGCFKSSVQSQLEQKLPDGMMRRLCPYPGWFYCWFCYIPFLKLFLLRVIIFYNLCLLFLFFISIVHVKSTS